MLCFEHRDVRGWISDFCARISSRNGRPWKTCAPKKFRGLDGGDAHRKSRLSRNFPDGFRTEVRINIRTTD